MRNFKDRYGVLWIAAEAIQSQQTLMFHADLGRARPQDFKYAHTAYLSEVTVFALTRKFTMY